MKGGGEEGREGRRGEGEEEKEEEWRGDGGEKQKNGERNGWWCHLTEHG